MSYLHLHRIIFAVCASAAAVASTAIAALASAATETSPMVTATMG